MHTQITVFKYFLDIEINASELFLILPNRFNSLSWHFKAEIANLKILQRFRKLIFWQITYFLCRLMFMFIHDTGELGVGLQKVSPNKEQFFLQGVLWKDQYRSFLKDFLKSL